MNNKEALCASLGLESNSVECQLVHDGFHLNEDTAKAWAERAAGIGAAAVCTAYGAAAASPLCAVAGEWIGGVVYDFLYGVGEEVLRAFGLGGSSPPSLLELQYKAIDSALKEAWQENFHGKKIQIGKRSASFNSRPTSRYLLELAGGTELLTALRMFRGQEQARYFTNIGQPSRAAMTHVDWHGERHSLPTLLEPVKEQFFMTEAVTGWKLPDGYGDPAAALAGSRNLAFARILDGYANLAYALDNGADLEPTKVEQQINTLKVANKIGANINPRMVEKIGATTAYLLTLDRSSRTEEEQRLVEMAGSMAMGNVVSTQESRMDIAEESENAGNAGTIIVALLFLGGGVALAKSKNWI